MTKGQLQGLIVGMISELDEIIKGEGEQAAGQQELLRCKEALEDLVRRLKPSRSWGLVSGAELLLVVGRIIEALARWARKR